MDFACPHYLLLCCGESCHWDGWQCRPIQWTLTSFCTLSFFLILFFFCFNSIVIQAITHLQVEDLYKIQILQVIFSVVLLYGRLLHGCLEVNVNGGQSVLHSSF